MSAPVDRYITAPPLVIDPSRSLQQAHDTMHRTGHNRLLVARQGHVYGVVSAHDLATMRATGVDTEHTFVATAVTRPPLKVSAQTDLAVARATMSRNHQQVALIVDPDDTGEIVGVITPAEA